MEFMLASDRDRSGFGLEKAVEKCLLSNPDQIDERDFSDPQLAQEVFLLRHIGELSRRAENKSIPKVLEDIDFILKNKNGVKKFPSRIFSMACLQRLPASYI